MLQVTSIKSQNEFGLNAAIKKPYGSGAMAIHMPIGKVQKNPKPQKQFENISKRDQVPNGPTAQRPKCPSVQKSKSPSAQRQAHVQKGK